MIGAVEAWVRGESVNVDRSGKDSDSDGDLDESRTIIIAMTQSIQRRVNDSDDHSEGDSRGLQFRQWLMTCTMTRTGLAMTEQWIT